MRKIIFSLLVSLLVPVAAFAAQVGFVPSTGVWFSRTDLKPGEMVHVYTVVVNNVYHELNGTVAFYDNDSVIGFAEFTGLKKDEAKQLRAAWEPDEGNHRISARFTRAEAVDEAGKKTALSLEAIVGTTGQPLVLANGATPEIGSTSLSVKQENDRLLITPALIIEEKNNDLVGQKKEGASSTLATSIEEFFSKNNALLNKAQSVAGTITSTAGKLEQAIAGTKIWIEEGGKLYETGKEKAGFIKPVADQVYKGWLVVTGDNDSKRIGVIIVVFLLSWFLIRRLRRRQRFYDDL